MSHHIKKVDEWYMRQIYPLDGMIVFSNPAKFSWDVSLKETNGRAVSLSLKGPGGYAVFRNVSLPERSAMIQLKDHGVYEWEIFISAGLMGIPSVKSGVRKFEYKERKVWRSSLPVVSSLLRSPLWYL